MNIKNSARKKVNLREVFTDKEKKIILTKSNGLCSHCGKPLTVDTVSVEHVIPLSKGGLNNMSNLVALCREDNRKKSNSIIEPDHYYRYLKPTYKEELRKNFSEYLQKTDWFDLHTFFPQDEYIIPNYSAVMSRYKGQNIISFFRDNYSLALQYGRYVMKNARYKDMDAILDYYRRNSKRYQYDPDHERKILEFCFKNGSVFTVTNNGRLIAVYKFYMNCVWVFGDVTFSVVVEYNSSSSVLNQKILEDYITMILVKNLLKENGFNKLLINRIREKNNRNFPMAMFDNSRYHKGSEEDRFDYDIYELWEYRYHQVQTIPLDRIPEEMKKGSYYYEKIFTISQVTEDIIRSSVEDLKEHMSMNSVIVPEESIYILGRLLRRVKNIKHCASISSDTQHAGI